jgi:hypothetical protein
MGQTIPIEIVKMTKYAICLLIVYAFCYCYSLLALSFLYSYPEISPENTSSFDSFLLRIYESTSGACTFYEFYD